MADTPEKDDRTEEPTQRRLDQAIERGDVAKSQEINTFFVLGGFALAILVLSGPVARTLALDLRGFLDERSPRSERRGRADGRRAAAR